jgi:hypothetical protein
MSCYRPDADIDAAVAAAHATLVPYADASWSVWGARLFPPGSQRADRSIREQEKLAMYLASEIDKAELVRNSDEDMEVVIESEEDVVGETQGGEATAPEPATATTVAATKGKGKAKVKEENAEEEVKEPTKIPDGAKLVRLLNLRLLSLSLI